MLTFADRVKAARKFAGMTQAELAVAMKVSPSAVRDWEARGRQPREAEVYKAIAVTTGVSADFILGITDVIPASDAAREWGDDPAPD